MKARTALPILAVVTVTMAACSSSDGAVEPSLPTTSTTTTEPPLLPPPSTIPGTAVMAPPVDESIVVDEVGAAVRTDSVEFDPSIDGSDIELGPIPRDTFSSAYAWAEANYTLLLSIQSGPAIIPDVTEPPSTVASETAPAVTRVAVSEATPTATVPYSEAATLTTGQFDRSAVRSAFADPANSDLDAEQFESARTWAILHVLTDLDRRGFEEGRIIAAFPAKHPLLDGVVATRAVFRYVSAGSTFVLASELLMVAEHDGWALTDRTAAPTTADR